MAKWGKSRKEDEKNLEEQVNVQEELSAKASENTDTAAKVEKEYDDYLAGLWHYDLKHPKLGMRKREDLEKIFTQNEFSFQKGSYQAGELCYMANYCERLLQSLQKQNFQAQQVLLKEKRKRTEEEEKQKKQRDELFQVTVNRRNIVTSELASWFDHLPQVYYLKANITGKPFIDMFGRVFLFTEKEAIDKAKAKDWSAEGLSLDFFSVEELKRSLYHNGLEQLLFNEGILPFPAERRFILPVDEDKTPVEKSEKVAMENNRALRFLILSFNQILHSKVDEENEEAMQKKTKALQHLEARIAPKLLSAYVWCKVDDAESEKLQFILLNNTASEHQAVAAYTNEAFIPDDSHAHKKMPFFPLAHGIVEDAETPVTGIIIDAGDLNFFLNKDWLKRLDLFGKNLVEQAKQREEAKKQAGQTAEAKVSKFPEKNVSGPDSAKKEHETEVINLRSKKKEQKENEEE